jgi:hypothetical protein
LLDQAIAIDRHYGPALAWAAICHMTLVRDGWAEEPQTTRRKANELAREALQVGENDPRILANAANVLALFGEDIDAMIGLADRALALNPSYAPAFGWSRRPRSCGNTESNSGRRGVSGGPGRRNRRLCCEGRANGRL